MGATFYFFIEPRYLLTTLWIELHFSVFINNKVHPKMLFFVDFIIGYVRYFNGKIPLKFCFNDFS